MQFSQRIGKNEANRLPQMESMSDALRIALWNTLFRYALGETDLPHTRGAGGPDVRY